MKIKRKAIWIALVLILAVIGLGVVNFIVYKNKDRVMPEFSYDTEVIYPTEEQADSILEGDWSSLLEGVHATDDREGDVTDRIVVHKITLMYEGAYAVVTYHVVDHSDNMAIGHRIAYLKSPKELTHIVMMNYLGHDPFEVVDEETDDTANKAPKFLMQEVVQLNVGETFVPQNYVVELSDDQDSPELLGENAVIEGNYDVNVPGTYVLTFYTRDSEGEISDPCFMKLIIQ